MNNKVLRAKRQQLRERVQPYGAVLERLPNEQWADAEAAAMLKYPLATRRIAVWISRFFLVQVYDGPEGTVRLAITKNGIKEDGNWEDGITWDQLQQIKREIGYGELDAVEFYPADCRLVNVANVRHMWVFPQPHPLALHFIQSKA